MLRVWYLSIWFVLISDDKPFNGSTRITKEKVGSEKYSRKWRSKKNFFKVIDDCVYGFSEHT